MAQADIQGPLVQSHTSRSFNAHTNNRYLLMKGPDSKQKRHKLKNDFSLKEDMKDTLQHAALINIVAAVNEDFSAPSATKSQHTPGSVMDSLNNTMAVITNLLTPRDKTVSIPKKQTNVFQLPKESVQRKPVYYKHSEDQEVKAKENKAKVSALTKEIQTNLPKVGIVTSSSKSMYAPLCTEHGTDYRSTYYIRPTTVPSFKSAKIREREKGVRNTSATRRLGDVKKEPRKTHVVPKCNAIDFLDTSPDYNKDQYYYNDLGHLCLSDTRQPSPPVSTPKPYIRANTLPVVFPAKTNRKPRAQSCQPIRSSNSRPISSSLRKRRPDSLYNRIMNMPGGFGFDSFEIGNGVNQEPRLSHPVSQDSTRRNRSRLSFAGIASKRHWGSRKSRYPNIMTDTIGFHTISRSVNFLDPKDKSANASLLRQMASASRSALLSNNGTGSNDDCSSNRDENDRESSKQVSFKDQHEVQEVNITDEDLRVDNGYSAIKQTAYLHDAECKNESDLTCNTFVTQFHNTGNKLMTNKDTAVDDESSSNNSNTSHDHIRNQADSNIWTFDGIHDRDGTIHKSAENDTGDHDYYEERPNKDSKRPETEDIYKVLKAIEPRPYQGFEHRKNRRTGSTNTKSSDDVKSHYVKIKLG